MIMDLRCLIRNLTVTVILGMSCFIQVHAADNDVSRYKVQMDIREAYMSGICIIREEPPVITATIVNEFGVSFASFRYDTAKDRIRILNVIRQMDRPAFRRILKKDFRQILIRWKDAGDDRGTTPLKHINERHKITYILIPITDYATAE